MSVESASDRPISNYHECSAHLLSAFFCLPGRSEDDERLRRRIEDILTDLAGVHRKCELTGPHQSAEVIQLKRTSAGS